MSKRRRKSKQKTSKADEPSATPSAKPRTDNPVDQAEDAEASSTSQATAPEAPPSFASRVRAVTFFVILAFMVFSPAVRQVFDINSALKGWTMYKGKGLGLMDVRYVIKHPDGSETPVNRFELLGYDRPLDAPRNSVWRIRGLKRLEALNIKLCEALLPETDLRVYIRVATEEGWVQASSEAIPVCGYLAVPYDPDEVKGMGEPAEDDD